MAGIRHRVGIAGDADEIFRAISEPEGLNGWWSTSASGAGTVRGNLELGFGEIVVLEFVVVELEPSRSLALRCANRPAPWRGSELRLALKNTEEQVFVTLVHSNVGATGDDLLYSK